MSQTTLENDTPLLSNIESIDHALKGILSWTAVNTLWKHICDNRKQGWFIYSDDNKQPGSTASESEVEILIEFLKKHLQDSLTRGYCGVVYTDSVDNPTIVRVYDPKELTSICNINGHIPAASWVITTQTPQQIALRNEAPVAFQYSNMRVELPKYPKHPQADGVLDARRMGCPLPLVNTSLALKKLAVGGILEVVAFEPGAVNDIAIFCQSVGHHHVGFLQGSYGYSFFIQRLKGSK